MGERLTTGDLDADGFEDIVSGAPNARHGQPASGSVHVLYGRRGAAGSIFDTETSPADYGGAHLYGENGNRTGASVATGDFNGDGYDDLIFGATHARHGTGVSQGRILVIFAENIPARDTGKGTKATEDVADIRILGDDNGAALGTALACADFDQDGCDDILASSMGPADTGMVQLFYGVPIKVTFESRGAISRVVMDQMRLLGDARGAHTGSALGAADFSGDGRPDALIGASRFQDRESGRTYLVRNTYLERKASLNLEEDERTDLLKAMNANDNLGICIAAHADMNRDGLAEVVVTSENGEDPNGRSGQSNPGNAVLLYGGESPEEATATEAFPTGPTPYRAFGERGAPVLRAWMAFDGGNEDMVSAKLIRNTESVRGLREAGANGIVDVMWQFETKRTGWSAAALKLRYTPAEVGELEEEGLVLVRADSPAGRWQQVPSQSVDISTNTVTATTPALGYFALVESNPR
jgi:hypothetical protein